MKKSMFFAIVILFSLNSFGQYPGQTENGRKEVPSIVGYFDKIPIVYQVGDLKWVHDVKNKAFVLFKGTEDSLLAQLIDWLSFPEAGKIPVVRFVETPIAPLTLFTRKELRQQSGADKKRVIELAQYKTYAVTVVSFTYVDELSDVERAQYTGTKLAVAKQPIEPAVVEENKTQNPPARSSAFKPRVKKYPRN
jgi:hypothetical protein